MSFVKMEDVVKTYKMGEVTISAVDGITFEIEKGEFVVIVGPSGVLVSDCTQYSRGHGYAHQRNN